MCALSLPAPAGWRLFVSVDGGFATVAAQNNYPRGSSMTQVLSLCFSLSGPCVSRRAVCAALGEEKGWEEKVLGTQRRFPAGLH